MTHLLSKSDFKLASTCAKKLVYKKAFYPTMNDANEYMEMQAQLENYVISCDFPVGILIHFGASNLPFKKVYIPKYHPVNPLIN